MDLPPPSKILKTRWSQDPGVPYWDEAAVRKAVAQAHQRTDQQIVDQTEELARMLLLQFHGAHPTTPEFLMRNAIEGRAARAWKVACMIQDLLTDTDVSAAVDNLEEA